ncbi:MAG: SCO family protein [Bernardetiaceae bacterium]|nr:SCO family protein [Bernardetiaceae bacterium]
MQNKKKWLILGAIFIVPIFFIILVYSGENEYTTLDIYYDLRNPEFDPGFIEANDCEPNFKDSVHHVRHFELINQDSQQVKEADMRGKIYVANFILTRCTQNICPQMSSELVRVQEAFGEREDVRIASFSIDPEHDTPYKLRKYAALYKANTKHWMFFTGEKEQIHQLAKCSYFIAIEDGGSYASLDHSDRFILIDKEGKIRGYYNGTSRQDVDRLINELQLLMREYERKA